MGYLVNHCTERHVIENSAEAPMVSKPVSLVFNSLPIPGSESTAPISNHAGRQGHVISSGH